MRLRTIDSAGLDLGRDYSPDLQGAAEWLRASRRQESGLSFEFSPREREREQRALTTAISTAGGFAAGDEGELAPLVLSVLNENPIRRLAQIVQVPRIGLATPVCDDTSTEGELLKVENVPLAAADPGFGLQKATGFRFSSKTVSAPMTLVMDAGERFVRMLLELLVRRINRVQRRYFSTGTGVAEPLGLVNRVPTVSANASASISADDVLSTNTTSHPITEHATPFT